MRNTLNQGYVHVYTGDGKGKTTAAIGLAVRAAGAGLRVLFAQFAKGLKSSEMESLARFSDCITVRQYGGTCCLQHEGDQEEVDTANGGLREIEIALSGGDYDLVILDEANIAVHFGLLSAGELLRALDRRSHGCEVVVTGRYASAELIDVADLVTEMEEVKHYYTRGVPARIGIEK